MKTCIFRIFTGEFDLVKFLKLFNIRKRFILKLFLQGFEKIAKCDGVLFWIFSEENSFKWNEVILILNPFSLKKSKSDAYSWFLKIEIEVFCTYNFVLFFTSLKPLENCNCMSANIPSKKHAVFENVWGMVRYFWPLLWIVVSNNEYKKTLLQGYVWVSSFVETFWLRNFVFLVWGRSVHI